MMSIDWYRNHELLNSAYVTFITEFTLLLNRSHEFIKSLFMFLSIVSKNRSHSNLFVFSPYVIPIIYNFSVIG